MARLRDGVSCRHLMHRVDMQHHNISLRLQVFLDECDRGFLPRRVIICSEFNHTSWLPESCPQRRRALLIYMLVLLHSAISEVAVTAEICFFYVIEKPQGRLLFFPLCCTPEAFWDPCGIRAATCSFSVSFCFMILTSLWANFSTVVKVLINIFCCFLVDYPLVSVSIFNIIIDFCVVSCLVHSFFLLVIV